MTTASIKVAESPLVLYALRRADDALILGHRVSEWCGHAPMLEEDMALANIGLDLIGQARELYTYAAKVENAGNDEDKFAYLRDVRQYRNLLLVEQPNGDFAVTIAKQFLYDAWHFHVLHALSSSSNERIAAIAAKGLKEVTYHLRRSSEWMQRLGDGTDESHARMLAAIPQVWRFTVELCNADEVEQRLSAEGVAPNPQELAAAWKAKVADIFAAATLPLPEPAVNFYLSGRRGLHTEHLGILLAEMQFLQRAYPDATW